MEDRAGAGCICPFSVDFPGNGAEGDVEMKIPQHVAIILDGNGRWASFLQMHTDDPIGVPFITSAEMPDGSAHYFTIQDGYQSRFIEHLVDFFATGIPQVESGETIDLMGMLETAQKALKNPFVWFDI